MIYFVEAVGVGNIKIGFTDKEDALERVAQLQTASPVPLRLLGTMPGTLDDEKNLHRRFASARVTGEWFRPVPELLELMHGVELPHLDETEVVVKSVQIKVLTVGRKSLSEKLLSQLQEDWPIDWESLVSELHKKPASGVNLKAFETGNIWGWIESGKGRKILFEQGGKLLFCRFLYYIHDPQCLGWPLFPHRISERFPYFDDKQHPLSLIWKRYVNQWKTDFDQLFIGV